MVIALAMNLLIMIISTPSPPSFPKLGTPTISIEGLNLGRVYTNDQQPSPFFLRLFFFSLLRFSDSFVLSCLFQSRVPILLFCLFFLFYFPILFIYPVFFLFCFLSTFVSFVFPFIGRFSAFVSCPSIRGGLTRPQRCPTQPRKGFNQPSRGLI